MFLLSFSKNRAGELWIKLCHNEDELFAGLCLRQRTKSVHCDNFQRSLERKQFQETLMCQMLTVVSVWMKYFNIVVDVIRHVRSVTWPLYCAFHSLHFRIAGYSSVMFAGEHICSEWWWNTILLDLSSRARLEKMQNSSEYYWLSGTSASPAIRWHCASLLYADTKDCIVMD